MSGTVVVAVNSNVSCVSLSYTGTNVVNVSAPLPFRVLFGSGVLASANGTVNGQQSSNASVDFSSVIPTSGTVTAYMVASASTVQQGAYQVVGPPVGHPDYNANFNPYTAYNETQDTLLFTATTTVPDNVTYMEVCRVTLTAGQTQITAANVSTAYQVLAAPTGGTLGVTGAATLSSTLAASGNISGAAFAATAAAASLAGTTAGTIEYVMPEQGVAKKFVAYANAYENDTTTSQTITFPVAFANVPAIVSNTTGLTVSATATTLTITAPDATTTYTGVIVIEGI